MSILEIFLLAFGLAMDCFAVSIAAGIVMKKPAGWQCVRAALLFGIFQAIMPLVGWWVAGRFSHLMQAFDHWIAFGILAFLGIRMIRESLIGCDQKAAVRIDRWQTVGLLAIATSIDALAVGISFAFLDMQTLSDVLLPVTVIGAVSLALSLFGFFAGCCVKRVANLRAELWGGIILIAIGVKIFIEHTIEQI
jgi:putative Mn2+ efflux pump MntP